MLDIEWEDVLGVLQTCQPYLITLAVILLAGITVLVGAHWIAKPKRHLARSLAGIGMVAGTVAVATAIAMGPMYTLINLSQGKGQVSQEATDEAAAVASNIADEGFVLLKNDDGTLPLKDVDKVNLFGWASTNPVYGGAGSGGINKLFPITTLIQGLEDSGFSVNQDLVDFYTSYAANRAAVSIQAQNWDLPEPPASTYSDELIQGAKDYSDVAIVVVSRMAGEGHNDIPQDMTKATYDNNSADYADFQEGEHYLQLSQTERDMVDLVCKNFDDVVVVVNSAYPMELGFCEERPQIKAVVLAPGAGNVGFESLGKILRGTVNPSGKTNDTYVYNLKDAPYYNNAEKTDYANLTDMTVEGMNAGQPQNYSPSFINYNEGIYVGYKYYETAAAEGVIDYDSTVQYPFGYGLSYTSFSQQMSDLRQDGTQVSFDVSVTNTGSVAGKDVVEAYYNPPYTNGGIEKASANLVRFDKTKLLEPGESQVITITFDQEDMASYDESGEGAYVLGAGDYEVSINSDSHTVLDSRTYNVPETITYSGDNHRASDVEAATNRFQDSKGDVTYLSRADHFANLQAATAAPSDLNMPEEYVEGYHLNSNYDPMAYVKDSDQMPATGVDSGLTLSDLRGADFDDPRWDQLVQEMSVSDLKDLIALAGYQTAAVSSIGKVQNVDADGPAAINNNFTGAGSIGFPVEVVVACTWNQDLAQQWGQAMGKTCREMNITGWYAPGMNTHRSAFTARNYEYFSEDGVLAGYMAANAIKGAASEGVYSTMKHFAVYDCNGKMVCVWTTEQALRENYLKPFEICVKEGGANAAMESWAFLGNKWVGELSTLNQDVLRGEWGFRGFVVSDFFRNNGHGFMNADMALANGVDAMLSTYAGGPNQVTDDSAASNVIYMQRAAKNILYTTSGSWAYDPAYIDTSEPAWVMAVRVADVAVAALLVLWGVLAWRHSKRLAA